MSDVVAEKIKNLEKRIESQKQEGKKVVDIKAPEANPAKLAERLRALEDRVTKLELNKRGEKNGSAGKTED